MKLQKIIQQEANSGIASLRFAHREVLLQLHGISMMERWFVYTSLMELSIKHRQCSIESFKTIDIIRVGTANDKLQIDHSDYHVIEKVNPK